MKRLTLVSIAILSLSAATNLQAAEYPTVDSVTQSKRDTTRLEILTTEKNKEVERLAKAQQSLEKAQQANDNEKATEFREAVEQHKVNISALDTEIENIGKKGGSSRVSQKQPAVKIAIPKQEQTNGQVPYWDTYNRPQTAPAPGLDDGGELEPDE